MFGKNKTKLKVTGRAGLIYSSAGRVMNIDSEMLGDSDYDIVIYEGSMTHWQPPHQDEPITINEMADIKQDIERLLKNSRIEWQS